MALAPIQRDVLRVIAERRRAAGEGSVASGVALNELLAASRRSRDVDLFHDTAAALVASWDGDRQALLGRGFSLEIVRERPTFVEALVSRGEESVVLEWSQDSAYRFFPLLEHPTLGLTLHPVDLATNKVLALVGRREPRDFVDVLACHESVQPFGFLAWAAAGKDPGFGPSAIVEEAARSARYSQAELNALDFEGPSPDAAQLSQQWHAAIAAARRLIQLLPPEFAGACVLDGELGLARWDEGSLIHALREGRVLFHEGRIRGAFPTARPPAAEA